MSARMRLRRADGAVYLDRWGIEWKPLGGIFIHRMAAPDPGTDLHDHPWAFVTIPLWGGYDEERAFTREPRRMRLDECHRIVRLRRRTAWTLVVHGPWRRDWGFYLPDGWVDQRTYDRTVRAERRDLWNEHWESLGA